ncbi:MAG TPA: GNAT family protein [Trueperaceae bacterium]|nr:GNAT family protein [Trueperaceae bacterium]
MTAFHSPQRVALAGRYAELVPLDPVAHGEDLFLTSLLPGAAERFKYLGQEAPERESFFEWLAAVASSDDPLFFAVIGKADGRCHGRQALMRIDTQHGVIELGNILWNPGIAKTRVATEAFFLAASYVFDQLGYRRFEWKCDSENLPSRRAAERFGFTFEGVFRQHMIVKGRNRDTAWFSLLDSEWPTNRAAFEAWLDPANFTADGTQKYSLRELRSAVGS